ncbi:RNA polymerase sigma-70 factor [Mucilaginibacter sp. KACC 22773]|uniref:RNA polymerase sigma factor n=1 Tax=Mucilaginibacter sp. KACC 22773 TaxID=3025671 RepID=UPI00236561F8|nr:RNA polymerase sigma-70 factor [Mucilaginibacter sp. KACC 22773]WDF77134.1 RNA polymerase sigma-70 factor [Mucilaginibacter sp. KACC 22773]
MVDYKSYSDFELAELLQSGDQLAYTEIYNRFHGALYIHVFNKLRNREEARDIVHELFSSLWYNCRNLSLKTTLSGYLYTSARYKIFDFISHKDVESKYIQSIGKFIEQDDCITDHLVREKELNAMIENEIAALPPRMREIFELSRKQNFTHKEIAELLGLSEKTVKKQVNNSLKVLRSKLGTAIFTAFIL